VKIDEKNNIHVELSYCVHELWDKSFVEFHLGKRCFRLDKEQLFLKKYQTVVLCQQGISNINMENIYDISKKSDVIIHLDIDL
jgi:hypothetical protein